MIILATIVVVAGVSMVLVGCEYRVDVVVMSVTAAGSARPTGRAVWSGPSVMSSSKLAS